MSQISRLARITLYGRLSDAVLGYNATLAAIIAGATYPTLDATVLTIPDWTEGGRNFLFGDVNPDYIANSDDYDFPFVTMDTGPVANTNRVLFYTFSGLLDVVTRIHLSWLDSGLLPPFSDYTDMAIQAFFGSVNSHSNYLVGANYGYNGRTICTPGPITQADYGFARSLVFASQFQIISDAT